MFYELKNIEKTINEISELDLIYLSTNNENLKIKKQIKDYYLINDYELLSIIIKNVYTLNHKELIMLRKHISNHLSFFKIIFNNYVYVRSNDDVAVVILSIIIYKCLNELKHLSNNTSTQERERFLKNKNDFKMSHSDKIINACVQLLEHFQIWIEIKKNEKIFFTNKSRLIFWFILKNVSKSGIIKQVKIFNNNKESIFLLIKNNDTSSNFCVLSLMPHNIYKKTEKLWYLYSYHYSTITKIFKENSLSGETVIFETEEIELMHNLCNNWVLIDKKILKWIFEDICLKEKIDPKRINEVQSLLMNNFKSALNINNIELISTLSKKISTILNIQRIKTILEMDLDDEKIYLPFSFDFRARLYLLSVISPTAYKEFRYCIHWGKYETLETKAHFMNKIIEDELDLYLNKLNIVSFFDEKTNEYNSLYFQKKEKNIKRALIWILIAIAEINKHKKKTMHIEEFINSGLQILTIKDKSIFKFEDRIKIKYYLNLLKEIENDIYIKRPLSKDATASVFQHLIKSLGAKTECALKICNLASKDTWYDTYKHIIDNFTTSISINFLTQHEYNLIFSRIFLKKIIMIYNYGAGKKKCISEFYLQINENNEILEILKNLNKDNEVRKILNSFYQFMTQENTIYQENINEIINAINKNEYTLKIENATINYKYNNTLIKQIELIHQKERFVRQEKYITEEININKTNISAKANYVQSLDAAVVRWYLRTNYGITIHDCFIIDYLNTTYLVSKINEGMRLMFHDLGIEKKINTDNIFSIFIIL